MLYEGNLEDTWEQNQIKAQVAGGRKTNQCGLSPASDRLTVTLLLLETIFAQKSEIRPFSIGTRNDN